MEKLIENVIEEIRANPHKYPACARMLLEKCERLQKELDVALTERELAANNIKKLRSFIIPLCHDVTPYGHLDAGRPTRLAQRAIKIIEETKR